MLSTLDNIESSPTLLNDVVNDINLLSSFIKKEFSFALKNNFKRKRKLSPQLLLYIITKVIGSAKSYHTVLDSLKLEKIVNIKEQSVNEKLQQIDYSEIESFNTKLCTYVFPTGQKRNLAVDCVRVNLYCVLEEFGIHKSQNGGCCTAIISAIIDVETNIPINYHIHLGSNQRDAIR